MIRILSLLVAAAFALTLTIAAAGVAPKPLADDKAKSPTTAAAKVPKDTCVAENKACADARK